MIQRARRENFYNPCEPNLGLGDIVSLNSGGHATLASLLYTGNTDVTGIAADSVTVTTVSKRAASSTSQA